MTDQTPSTEDVRDAFIVTRETIQDVALSVLSKYPGHHDQSAAREIAALASNAGRPAAAHDRETAAKARADVLRKVATEIEQQSATEGYRTRPSEGLYAATRALDTAARNIRYRIGAGDE